MKTRCAVLDASSIFHLRDLYILQQIADRFYITDRVLDELKDSRAIATVEILQPEIVTIEQKVIETLRKKYPELSDADCSIIACIEKIRDRCSEIVVLTDDMKLREVLTRLGVKVQTIYFGKQRKTTRLNP